MTNSSEPKQIPLLSLALQQPLVFTVASFGIQVILIALGTTWIWFSEADSHSRGVLSSVMPEALTTLAKIEVTLHLAMYIGLRTTRLFLRKRKS